MTGIRNDIRPDTRNRANETSDAGCARSAPTAPRTLAQPDLDQMAAANRQLGNDVCRDVPQPTAAKALDYSALLGGGAECPSHLGVGEAGTPSPAEMAALQKTQQAVVDAGVTMFAAAAGMDITEVAERFDSSVAELEQLNPGLAQQLRESVGKFTGELNIAVPIGASDAAPPAMTPDATTKQQYGARYGVPSPSMQQVGAAQATMVRGMGGESVVDLQRRLNSMGANLEVDGKFGPRTEAALKAFQQSNGIQQTGVLGRQTFAALENPQARRIAAEGTRPGRTTTTTGPQVTTPAGDLTGSAFGQQVAAAAERSARSLNSVGACALGVNNALISVGVPGRGHAYQKAEQLARSPRFREMNVSAGDLRNLPPGAVVVWGRSAAKPYGHVSVALGGGREASDHVQNQITGGRYGTDFGAGPDAQGRQFRVFLPR
ncbi:MAG: peptidoglycan-binding domain-containing protein [Deltaproteobacteria bacterium]|nr:peptidoglycan-binding domain-containing protein [Deltaproteobacteria bacterium]